MSSLKPIQQQMYTRERQGIFRAAEGFDTIAKSQGLENNWIKKVLHPLCVYDAPAELASRGEKDEKAYPDAVHLVRTENGDIVLGRSLYKAADFTGLRSAFFTHNFVIPAGHGEGTADYKQWLNTTFADSYDIEQGMELPELDTLPAEKIYPAVAPASVLTELNIDEQTFKRLLYAVMTSLSGRKKVYVSLNVPAGDTSTAAKKLLFVLYGYMPYDFRKKLGFLTYAAEPASRKGMHLTFVPQGSLRPGDRNMEKEFVFDLPQGRILNAEAEEGERPFVEFMWEHVKNGESPEAFFKFADQMLRGMEFGRELSLQGYDELSVFYRMERGENEWYQRNKASVLQGLNEYLTSPEAMRRRMRLNDLFLASFDREFDAVRQGALPDPDVIKCFKDYYNADSSYLGNKLIEYLIRSLNNLHAAKRTDLAARICQIIDSSPALCAVFLHKVLSTGALTNALFLPYAQEKLARAADVQDMLDLFRDWGRVQPELLNRPEFQKLAEAAVMDRLRSMPQRHEATVHFQQSVLNMMHERLGTPAEEAMLDKLYEAGECFLLTEVKLQEITPAQLKQLGFCTRADLGPWVAQLPPRLQSLAVEFVAAYDWFTTEKPEPSLLLELSEQEREHVQGWAKRWLPAELQNGNYARLLPAYSELSEKGSRVLNYDALLRDVRSWAGDVELVFRFIRWSEELGDPRKGFHPDYQKSLMAFFKEEGKEGLHKKALWRRHFEQAQGPYLAFYNKAKRATDPPLLQTLRKLRKGRALLVLLATAALVAVVVVFASGLLSQEPEGTSLQTAQTNNTLSPATTEAEPISPQQETPAVQVTLPAEEGGSTVKGLKLLFAFTDFVRQETFEPESINITDSEGERHEFKDFTLEPVTSDASTGDGEGTLSVSGTGSANAQGDTQSTGSENGVQGGTQSAGSENGTQGNNEPAGAENGSGNPSGSTAGSSTTGAPAVTKRPSYPYKVLVTINEDYSIQEGSTVEVDGEEYPITPAADSEEGTAGEH
ncbi:GAP1-N2 domain-containing protein [Paenibacillus jiagnxiensis]|uniref:GAP1-N2 domain-containing protein n=1 Tax=Paenibacillus jiagnxiensis TaxID=3228926 RepID=UPI0033B95ACC